MRESEPDGEIIIFHKPLKQGLVKTRLAAAVGHEAAMSIYRAMLKDMERNLAECSESFVPYVSKEPETSDELFWPKSFVQRGGDLGERMAHAFQDRFDTGISKAVLIGSDIPAIDNVLINQFLLKLETNDAVIGPSDDGGYYLIGFTSKGYDRGIFEGIPWSTDRVLELTKRVAEEAGLRVWVGPRLTDVDTVGDLQSVIKTRYTNGKIDHLLAAWNEVNAERGSAPGGAVSIGETI